MIPDITDMTPVRELTDAEDIALAKRATDFLASFRWCSAIRASYQAFDFGKILGIFLFQIEPKLVGVDDTLWVIVGDLPPAFLVCDNAEDWYQALQRYIEEMQRWIDAVRTGGNLDNIVPVNATPTKEHAEMLSIRLRWIKDHVIDDKPFTD